MIWEEMTLGERERLVAGVFGDGIGHGDDGDGSEGGDGERSGPVRVDAATAVRLIARLADERRLSALTLQFDLWPHVWSAFFRTRIAGTDEEIHLLGTTFTDALCKGALTLHDVDVDVDGVYQAREGTPSEQRAVWALLGPVARVFAEGLLADRYRDVLAAYRRVGDDGVTSRAVLAARVAHELGRMADAE